MNKEEKHRQIFSLENNGNKLMYKSGLEIISVSRGTTCPEYPFCTVKQLPLDISDEVDPPNPELELAVFSK